MIAMVDYGVGNLFSLKSSLAHLGLEAVVTAAPARLRAAGFPRVLSNIWNKWNI